jgi:hypothetical protein
MRIIPAMVLTVALAALAACSVPPLKPYAYPAWGFAISLRAPPKVVEIPASADGATPRRIALTLIDAGRSYDLSATDASKSTKSDDQILSEVPKAMAEGVGGTLGSETYVATGQVVGREFTIDKPGQATARVRIFVAHRRLYEIVSQSTLGPDDPEVTTFLDSFQLTGS